MAPLLPEHAGDRAGAGHDRSGLRRHGPQVLRALPVDRLAMAHLGGDTGMWDEEDGFFYDVLRLPDGQAQRLKVRSMVGLLPLVRGHASSTGSCWRRSRNRGAVPVVPRRAPELVAAIHDPRKTGVAGRRLASILDETKLRRVLAKMLDENEFLSPTASARCRATTPTPVRHPRRRPGVPRRLPAGRIGHRHVRRQLELARARSGCRSTP